MNGTVFNIQHYTIHDGPGIRTELFLKGCPLRCPWCSNPEGQKAQLQVGVYASKCLSEEACGLCAKACPSEGALLFTGGRLTGIDRERCTGCMQCVDACPSEAVRQWGEKISAEDALKEVLKDKGYYQRSGGGITVSGGEPLLQAEFIAELFRLCREEGIHTCLESTLYAEWETIEKVIPFTDLLMTDIKHMDSEAHKNNCGAGNEKTLRNLRKLSNECSDLDIIIRIPVIPGVNDDPLNIEKTADFILNEMNGRVRTLQLLSFMRLGEEKYQSLGMPYPMEAVELDREAFQRHIEEIAEYFVNRGIHCVVGTREKNARK